MPFLEEYCAVMFLCGWKVLVKVSELVCGAVREKKRRQEAGWVGIWHGYRFDPSIWEDLGGEGSH